VKRATGLALALVVATVALGVAAGAAEDERIAVGEPQFGYWAPRIRELSVYVNGKKARYALWCHDGVLRDFYPIRSASKRRLVVWVPLPWRAGQTYTLKLDYEYAGQHGEQTVAATAPAEGGAWEPSWEPSDGGNYGFLVREPVGLERRDEPVEFDLTARADVFTDPQRTVRATIMTAPGRFEEIPCQVYAVERMSETTRYTDFPLVRFRACVQLTVEPHGERMVFLWNCPDAPERAHQPGVKLEGGALGGVVENRFYRIALDPRCGLMRSWHDKATGTDFQFVVRRRRGTRHDVMNYTPDVYRVGAPWSHTSDWQQPENRVLSGPVFCETSLWGPMRRVPEVASRVTQRFYAGRPEVRLSSVIRVLQDVKVWGFRNGGLVQSADLYTHAAWPRPDGSIVRMSAEACLGNDTGAPPAARMPADTPWVAFYHAGKRYGLALVCPRYCYFNTGPDVPNASTSMRYVSLYRGRFIYTIRALTMTYFAEIRSYHTLLKAGTTAWEQTAMLPFTFEREDADQFSPVQRLLRELRNPLVARARRSPHAASPIAPAATCPRRPPAPRSLSRR